MTCFSTADSGFETIIFTNVAQTAQILSGTTISLKIDSQFRNPADTGSVTGFHIKTYHSDGYQIE